MNKELEGEKKQEFHCGFEESGGYAYNCNDCPNKCEEWYQWDKEFKMRDFEKSMVEMTKRANDFVHEKRAEGITVIPARDFFEAIGITDFFFGNDVGIDISNFKGDEE